MAHTNVRIQVSATGTDCTDVIEQQERYELLCRAAPDLFEALQMIDDILKRGLLNVDPDELEVARNLRRAAIAKATHKPQEE